MRKRLLFSLLAALFMSNMQAQVLLNEDFESGSIPPGWTQKFVNRYESWEYITGGHWGNPETAASGSKNAAFIVESPLKESTKLITPSLNLTVLTSPKLSFYIVQKAWWVSGNSYNDELRIFYKKSFSGNWIPVEGATYTHSINNWTRINLYLDPTDVSSTYYIAFEATTGYGHGTCIDSVVVEEGGLVNKSIDQIYVDQASTNFVGTGTINNPILRINISALGNQGTLNLESLQVTSMNTDDTEISPNGVKLFATETDEFVNYVQLGSATNFNAGVATFSSLSKEIDFGANYFWISYDVSSGAVPDHIFDAKIAANAITVSGSTFPATEISPAGSRSIQQVMLYENFESPLDWTLSGFEIGTARRYGGGEGGNADPSFAYSGVNILRSIDTVPLKIIYGVNDIPKDTVIDSLFCNYVSAMEDREYYAISPTIDCKYFNNTRLNFSRWLNIEIWDNAYIDISTDSMKTWKTIWSNSTNFVTDNKWGIQELDISGDADRKEYVNIRFSLGSSSGDKNYSGWNLDNFIITANFINSDVSVTELISPVRGCEMLPNEPVTVKVRNFAGEATKGVTPIEYSFDGGITFVRDTLTDIIPVGGEVEFTFQQTADLSVPQYYYPVVRTVAPDDEDITNDEFIGDDIFSIPTYTIPYETDFEASDDYWEVQGSPVSTWQWGNPAGIVIKETASGINAWVTDLDGRFNLNDSSFVVSPCFDFTGIYYPVFECKFFFAMDSNAAGFRVEYSLNQGQTWKVVPNDTYPYNWQWLNPEDVSVFQSKTGDGRGWTGIQTEWKTYRAFLPSEIANKNGVKFRVAFMSTATGNRAEGVAFDDVRIYNAPKDIGVVTMTAPDHACELTSTEPVTVEIRNFGLDTIRVGEKLVVAMEFMNAPTLIDTFTVSSPIFPGNDISYTFSQTVDVHVNGTYYLETYTMLAEDTAFYEVNNDSIIDSVVVYGLAAYDLGQDFGSTTPASVILDAGAGYASYNWSTGETTQTTAIPGEGKYYVTVTNDSACVANDSVTVLYSAKDISCTGILNLANGCAADFATPKNIQISIKCLKIDMFSDSIFFANDNVYFGYQINNEDPVLELYVSNDTLVPDSSMTYTFMTPADLSTYGDYSITAFTLIDRDINISNDHSDISISNWGYPTVDLGVPVIKTADPTTLVFDAGPGYGSYLWQDGSTNQTFSVTEMFSQEYKVIVTDIHACGSASDSVQIYTYDFGLTALVSPVTGCNNGTTEQLSFSVTNHGNDTIQPSLPIRFAYLFNNTLPIVEDTFYVSSPLAPDSTTIFTFPNTFDLSVQKNYNFKIFNRFPYDINTKNDVMIKDVSTYGYPVVNIGYDTIFTANKDTVFLNATADRDANYLWNANDQSGSNSKAIFDVINPQSFYYKVTVTANGCSVKDSTMLWMKDLAMNTINVNDQVCSLSDNLNITVSVKNTKNDPYRVGDKVILGLAVDQKHIIYDTLVFATELFKDQTRNFTFSEPVDISSVGIHKIRAFIYSKYDINSVNDVLDKYVNVKGYPAPDLGFDTIITNRPDTVVLKVAPGFETYVWNGTPGGTNVYSGAIDHAGPYTIRTSWSPSCYGYDTVQIIAQDIKLFDVFGIGNSCVHAVDEALTFDICNPGTIAIPAGSEIVFSYSLNSVTYSDTLTLASDFKYNDTISYTSDKTIDASALDVYDISAWISYVNDFKSSNNTYSFSFATFGNPTPDFVYDTIYSTQPDTIVLKSTENYLSLQWSTGTFFDPFPVPSNNTTTYFVTVTDDNQCQAKDTIAIINRDLALIEIVEPNSSCFLSDNEQVSIYIKNIGLDTYPAGTQVYTFLTVNNALSISDTLTLSQNLVSGDTVLFTFDTPYNFISTDTFALRADISSHADFISKTDTWRDTVINQAYGTFDLGVDYIVSGSPDTVTIVAPGGYASYLWSDNTTNPVFNVPTPETKYWAVTVANDYGCLYSDSVMIATRFFSVDTIIADTASCDFGGRIPMSAVFINSGKDVIPAGSTVGFKYNWSGVNPKIVQDTILTTDLAADEKISIVFDSVLAVAGAGIYTLEVKSFYVFESDTISTNATQKFYQYEQPVIDINGGLDSVATSLPYVLSVINGYDEYLWSTTAIDTFAVADASGWYKVTVTSADGCFDTDSILILSYDLGLNTISYPVSVICSVDYEERVTATLTNYGYDTLRPGYSIPVHYKVNNGTTISETITLDSDLSPQEALTFDFQQAIQQPQEGSFVVKLWLSPDVDVNKGNDTVLTTFEYHLSPSFVLNGGENNISVYLPNFVTGPDGYDSYSWSNGITTQNMDITASGTYTLTVTDEYGCEASDAINITVLIDDAIVEIQGAHFEVYPIPAGNTVNVEFEQAIPAGTEFSLFTSSMQKIAVAAEQNGTRTISLDVSGLTAGVYFLHIENGDQIVVRKVVVK